MYKYGTLKIIQIPCNLNDNTGKLASNISSRDSHAAFYYLMLDDNCRVGLDYTKIYDVIIASGDNILASWKDFPNWLKNSIGSKDTKNGDALAVEFECIPTEDGWVEKIVYYNETTYSSIECNVASISKLDNITVDEYTPEIDAFKSFSDKIIDINTKSIKNKCLSILNKGYQNNDCDLKILTDLYTYFKSDNA